MIVWGRQRARYWVVERKQREIEMGPLLLYFSIFAGAKVLIDAKL